MGESPDTLSINGHCAAGHPRPLPTGGADAPNFEGTIMAKWTCPKAEAEFESLTEKIETIFKVPPEIARAEPHVFQGWFYKRQCEAARLRIDAGILFLTFTTA